MYAEILLARQLKCEVSCNCWPAPVEPVMPVACTSPRAPSPANGNKPNIIVVAKHPGLAMLPACFMASLFNSGKPYTKSLPFDFSPSRKSWLRSITLVDDGMPAPSKNLAFPMAQAKENHIHGMAVRAGKYKVAVAQQIPVYVRNHFPRLAAALHKGYFNMGMVDQQPHHFPTGIACPAYNSCFYFIFHYWLLALPDDGLLPDWQIFL